MASEMNVANIYTFVRIQFAIIKRVRFNIALIFPVILKCGFPMDPNHTIPYDVPAYNSPRISNIL